ncbi:MAG: alpha/beta hydrolase [Nitrospinae bacterium]|nr:alpha/beta hydrolase [Nitrospinota bacterium]
MTEFVYLHGFASSPQSRKAEAFKKKFNEIGIPLEIPDLEGGDFENMTLTSQMNILNQHLDRWKNRPACLIGSSMGGYLAVLAAEKRKEVQALYLMAPGFNFMNRWMQKLNLNSEDEAPSLISVFHYRFNEMRKIRSGLFKDAVMWSRLELDRKLPTRIVHGIHDDTVEISESREFARTHSGCRLKELDADHSLLTHIDWIVEDCLVFF